MTAPESFTLEEGYARYRPVGEISLQAGAELVGKAIAFAAEAGVRKLLVDITRLTGFDRPDITARFSIVETWARAAPPGMRFVMVARPEFIDRAKFGVTVARNRGMTANVFASEREALDWLLSAEGPFD